MKLIVALLLSLALGSVLRAEVAAGSVPDQATVEQLSVHDQTETLADKVPGIIKLPFHVLGAGLGLASWCVQHSVEILMTTLKAIPAP